MLGYDEIYISLTGGEGYFGSDFVEVVDFGLEPVSGCDFGVIESGEGGETCSR